MVSASLTTQMIVVVLSVVMGMYFIAQVSLWSRLITCLAGPTSSLCSVFYPPVVFCVPALSFAFTVFMLMALFRCCCSTRICLHSIVNIFRRSGLSAT